MAANYSSPGVYRQEVFLKPPPVLQTGVPGFVGFADPPPGGSLQLCQPVALSRKEEFDAMFGGKSESFLKAAVTGFFDNGGLRCYVVAADSSGDRVQGLMDAIGALAPLEDMDLVAVPDASTLLTSQNVPDKVSIGRVQAEMLLHCAQQGNRFAILDSLPSASVEDVMDQCKQLAVGQNEPLNGALYYPWLLTSEGADSASPSISPNIVPPCGHVAGIYGRSDAKRGVFKAPANEEIFGVLDLETQIDKTAQDRLNPSRVNCLRAFAGRGIRVWGAQTVGSSEDWRYINVRRLFLTVRRWIDLNMGWATFEPNDFRLWVRIQRELTAYLTRLQSNGALQGTTPAEAFYVKCDAENNPPESRELGEVAIEIGLAPLSPAEFIVVRIVRRAGGTVDS